jgi:hypothetical protein
LEKADSVESYDAILSYLRNRAAEKGCEAWLERQLARLEEAPAAR